ncbi:hypothetical protein CEXT_506601 [Caerostris extrusa]|uniref:Uncharacterized protein n=1 Tax=Caerostris extrusa TaxID=172846 RepID=A0AAV4N5B4_CAEEX|nr:hypothetical protein CEXT_506601 [Caerostris extrusa]
MAESRASIEKENNFKCDVCGRRFSQKRYLTQLCHSGSKPHECHICGGRFVRKCALNKHLLLHDGLKSHKCEMCGRCFVRKEK